LTKWSLERQKIFPRMSQIIIRIGFWLDNNKIMKIEMIGLCIDSKIQLPNVMLMLSLNYLA
jgi:hypothetical protein